MAKRVVWLVSADESFRRVFEAGLTALPIEVRAGDPTVFLTGVAEGQSADVAVVEDPPRGLSRPVFEARLRELNPFTRVLFIAANSHGARGTEASGAEIARNVRESVNLVRQVLGDAAPPASAEREVSVDELKATLVRTLESYSNLIERYEFLNGGNGPNVRRYAIEVGKEMGLNGTDLDALSIASLIYDMGMMRIRPEVKMKATPLTSEDLAAIRQHPRLSCEFAASLGLPWEVTRDILHHHEAYDGSGYPDGLVGRQIPLGARILAVGDAFFAMTSRRPNRPTRTEEEALAELNRMAGHQFDPEVVEIFGSLVQVYFLDQEGRGEKPPRRLALVDDARELRTLLAERFSGLGYEVVTVGDAERALALVVAAKPEAIVVNADVGWMDAYQFLHRVRQEATLSGVPVLFLSERDSSPEARARALEAAADDYLVSPIDPQEVADRVNAAIRSRTRLTNAEFVRPPQRAGIRGKLSELGLPEICQILSHGFKTARVTVLDAKAQGQIFFEDGQPRHATYLDLRGREAFFEMLKANEGEFCIEHGLRAQEVSIDDRLEFLLMEGMRQIDEAGRFK